MSQGVDRTIYESATTRVKRSQWEGRPVIIKSLKPAARSAAALARYTHEFRINQSLTSPFICRAVAFDEAEHRILFEDPDGRALRELIQNNELTLDDALDIALSLTEALQSIHDEGVIHRDLNPGNVIVTEDPWRVYLIDFGLATLEAREYPLQDVAGPLTGTLPYVSPEQTGRVNRVVDYRTDLYSLGATLYELFSGAPPFTNSDPLELIHAHIASTPKPLHLDNPQTPQWLSDVVQKLLAKQPEDRYQSASSTHDDLAEGQQHSNVIPFRLGQTDAPGQLALPKRIYGREADLDLMLQALARAKSGDSVLVEVTGPDGIGKSVVCDHLVRSASDQQILSARVIATDVTDRDGPGIWLELTRRLMRQALALTSSEAQPLLERLQQLAPNHQESLRRQIPELRQWLTRSANDPSPAQTAVAECLRALHPQPITLILEDVDRLPLEDLNFLLASAVEFRHLLLCITQTDPEPALFTRPRLATKRVHLPLGALEKHNVRKLLADMLSHGEARVRELAAELHAKTDGVPGPLLDLIFELHRLQAIEYDGAEGEWRWDLERIRGHYFSNNSTERVSRQLETLPLQTRWAMTLGSVTGESFTANLLRGLLQDLPLPVQGVAVAGNAEAGALPGILQPAINLGLIRDVGVGSAEDPEPHFRFSHSRIHSLVYSAIDPERKAQIHSAIARRLKTSRQRDALPVMEVADHLNAGIDPSSSDAAQRADVAHHNLLAARAALQASRFQAAYKYARSGLMLCQPGPDHATLGLELCQSAAEAAFLCGDFDQLYRVLREAPAGSSALDEIRIRAAAVQNHLADAQRFACEALNSLGVKIAPRPVQRHPPLPVRVVDRLRSEWRRVRRRFARALPDPVPVVEDPRVHQTFRLFGYLLHIGYHLGTPGLPAIADRVARQARRDGFSPEVTFILAARAAIAIADGDFRGARRYAEHTRILAARFPGERFTIRSTSLLYGLVDPWFTTLDQTLNSLTENIAASMATQDYEFAGAASAFYAANAIIRGAELGSLKQSLHRQISELAEYQHVTGVNITRFVLQITNSLLGQADVDPDPERGHNLTIRNPQDGVAHGYVYVLRLYYAVLFQDFQGAANILRLARNYASYLEGSPLQTLYRFAESLVLLHGDDEQRAELGGAARVRRNLRRMRRWMRAGARHVEPKLLVLQAEIAWRRGATTRALELFERAAERARRLGTANDEALAYELAARLCDRTGRTDFARLFARNAYQAYTRWGAAAKTNQLERDFHALLHDGLDISRSASLSMSDLAELTVRDIHTQTGSYENGEFNERIVDTTTVLRAAQTISGEILLDQVLTKLLRLALEHAGAQKACMLLAHDRRLFVEAIASVDGGPTHRVIPAVPLEASDEVPESIIQFVARTKETLVVSDATQEDVFTQDPYVKRMQPLSVLCLPIVHRGEISGILYIEHRWLTGVFTRQRVEVLALLSSQAAISIENARLYADLQSTRDEYRALYDNAIEGLFRISPQGVLLSANPTLARILGFDNVSQLQDEYRELFDRVFLSREQIGTFLSDLEQHRLVTNFEAQGVTRHGRTLWMALTARLNLDPDGGEYIDGSLIDISERIKREQADKQRQIAEAATHAKSAFLANMSHEIRTPMNAIVGFSKLALDTALNRKQHEYVTSIRNAAENLLTLVNDILDFSKIEAGKLTLEQRAFKLGDTLGEVERLFRTELRRRNLNFVVEDNTALDPLFPEDGVLVGDALRLQQVLVNLVGNAVKFTESGGIRLVLAVKAVKPPELMLDIAIVDTGIGISEEQQSRLFESFVQAESSTTRRFGGTGLGLTICKRLIEVMGGEISVESELNRGSTFRFTAMMNLPTADESLPDQAARRKRNTSILRDRYILVAEDNPINQQLAMEFLQRAGARVDIAQNGREAVDRATSYDYDAILMDIHMPVLDGMEATRLLREQRMTVPIIAVSADALSTRRTSALEAGCDAYVTKPIDFDQLLGELAHLLPETDAALLRRRASDRDVLEAERNRLTAVSVPPALTVEPEYLEHNPEALPLQRVPGIDIALAIKGHNGNVKLMIKLMGDFGSYYGDAGTRMRRLITAGEFEEAERLAHNLHGVAGSFGARRLQEASKTLELALGEPDGKNLLGLAQSFEIALTEVLESADALASDEVRFRATDFGER